MLTGPFLADARVVNGPLEYIARDLGFAGSNVIKGKAALPPRMFHVLLVPPPLLDSF